MKNGVTSSIVRRDADISEELEASELHPLLKKIYANRGVTSLKQVDYSLKGLLDFALLKDIDVAAELVSEVIIEDKRIVVVGDFDADGATSCAVMVRSLRAFGLSNVEYLVPNRFDFGYGLSPQIVDVAAGSEPELIITVDNGISSIDGVRRAAELGIQVVVTDHHLAADVLPEAAAIVNPNQPGCEFPSKMIAGVGVAFYLMLAVRARLRDKDWFADGTARVEPKMANYLDLVALGTVADVVPLDVNNRILVESGLQRIRRNKACAGINALLTIAGKSIEGCSSQDFGFIIGPRLNAAGRLDDMSIGIECLLCDDYEQAFKHASTLNHMNQQRRQIEGEMLDQAYDILNHQMSLLDDEEQIPDALALYDAQWHQGVVGLLASRIKEKYHRPVIAFANAVGGELKGSGRSIPGLHMRDVLDVISKQHAGLIEKFGGHAMAAGLSIRQENFSSFRSAFNEHVSASLRPQDLDNINESDGPVAEKFMTMEASEIIKYASPWGQLFPEPVFDDEFKILNWRIVGEKHLKLELMKEDSGACYSAIAFNKTDDDLPLGDKNIHVVYRLDVNEFRGNRSLQLIIQHIEAA
ncbi:MAG: single-stranded-DNA-specific exonuclease RecJ [Gammaproteobacteria bacterium]|nr:single-stranded-DNA-specific exonuclease RecJ [Gammaproteobacteria bacterium]NNJ49180.1 single-stranded-DNA-specific exonuclease RecJ [Gammaproteobacteria bacterium]